MVYCYKVLNCARIYNRLCYFLCYVYVFVYLLCSYTFFFTYRIVSRMYNKYTKGIQRVSLESCHELCDPRMKHLWIFSLWLSNSVQLNTTREVTTYAATRELPSISWNWKVHYRIHNSSPLIPMLSHANPVHINPFCLSKIQNTLILSWSS
jgi:hypothetical protein